MDEADRPASSPRPRLCLLARLRALVIMGTRLVATGIAVLALFACRHPNLPDSEHAADCASIIHNINCSSLVTGDELL